MMASRLPKTSTRMHPLSSLDLGVLSSHIYLRDQGLERCRPPLRAHWRNMSTLVDRHDYRHRRVVSSFICVGKPHTSNFRISLFKRSGKVRNYPNLWAACSGSVENSDASPQEAALREIGEETGIRENRLELLVAGTSFELVDEGLKTRWKIFPFFWSWRGDEEGEGGETAASRLISEVKLDYEHAEIKLVKPEEVLTMNTVPNLHQTVESGLKSIQTMSSTTGSFCI